MLLRAELLVAMAVSPVFYLDFSSELVEMTQVQNVSIIIKNMDLRRLCGGLDRLYSLPLRGYSRA